MSAVLVSAALGVRCCGVRRFALGERIVFRGRRHDGELPGDGRRGDDGARGIALDGRLGLTGDAQGGEVDLALGEGSHHAQFRGLGGEVLRGVEVLHLLGEVLVLLRQGGLLTAELDQLVLRGRDGDVQDQHGHEGNRQEAEAEDDERRAALAGCRADQRQRSA